MAEVVVDASVVVKWYIPERHHEQAQQLRDDYLDGLHALSAPALLPFEVVNALRYSGHFDDEQLDDAAVTLPEYGIELVPFRDIGPTTDVASELDITVYDASYLALASTTDGTVYTSDEALIDDVAGSEFGDDIAHIGTYGDTSS